MDKLVPIFLFLCTLSLHTAAQGSVGGQWDLVGRSGVSAMHAILSPTTNRVVFIEKVQMYTGAFHPFSKTSWSTEYNFDTNTYRHLDLITDAFCSSGSYLPNGTMVNVGGAEAKSGVSAGFTAIRFLNPSTDNSTDWRMIPGTSLSEGRWYPTTEQLADGTLFILGGSSLGMSQNNATTNVDTFELYPPRAGITNPTKLPFLTQTLPNNLYPVVHLLPDGNLFIFASVSSIIINSKTFQVVSTLPDLGPSPRSYPLSGGSILLPLSSTNNYTAEVLICGGSTEYTLAGVGISSCGRITPLIPGATWVMENMPMGRIMPDLLHTSDGNVIILNGCAQGYAGYAAKGVPKCTNPVYTPVFYKISNPSGQRFSTGTPAMIARMYHSVALTAPDGRVMVAGSNPVTNPDANGPFPTDFRVEMFTPPFLLQGIPQPVILATSSKKMHYSGSFSLTITTYQKSATLQVALQQSGFITHSTHMSQRFVWLDITSQGSGQLTVKGPPSPNVAPPAWYMLRIVEGGVPSKALWIQLTN